MLVAFIVALLLLAGAVEPTQGWLIVLAASAGVSAMRLHLWAPLWLRPAFDLRMLAFVLSILLLAGAIDATRDWLIALSICTGLATFMPSLISLDAHDSDEHGQRRWRRSYRHWNGDTWS